MTDRSDKYSNKYKLSISNPKVFDAVKMGISILIGLTISFVILIFVSNNPVNAIITILTGPLTKTRYIGGVIQSFIPYAFAGLSAGVLFKAGAFNMGSEGVFILSGVVITAIATSPITTSSILHPILCYLGAIVFGGTVMILPSLLKAKFNTNEMVVSLMLNSVYAGVAAYLVRTFLGTVQRGSNSSKDYLLTAKIGNIYEPLKISVCLFLLIAVTIILYLVMTKSRLGYQIRLAGTNPSFANYSGINAFKLSITTAAIAGVLSAMGATTALLTQTSYYTPSQSLVGIGFSGMLLAMLGRNNPIGIVIAAFLVKYLEQGSQILYFVDNKVPSEIIAIIEGVIIMLVSSQYFLRRFRERKLLEEGLEEHAE